MLVLDNASVAAESHELGQCLGLWRRVQEGGGGECCAAGVEVGAGFQPQMHTWECVGLRGCREGKQVQVQPCSSARWGWPLTPPPSPAERWGKDWALLALAAADNTALCLEHYGDRLAG